MSENARQLQQNILDISHDMNFTTYEQLVPFIKSYRKCRELMGFDRAGDVAERVEKTRQQPDVLSGDDLKNTLTHLYKFLNARDEEFFGSGPDIDLDTRKKYAALVVFIADLEQERSLEELASKPDQVALLMQPGFFRHLAEKMQSGFDGIFPDVPKPA